jgi:hypothetical protein
VARNARGTERTLMFRTIRVESRHQTAVHCLQRLRPDEVAGFSEMPMSPHFRTRPRGLYAGPLVAC